MQKNIFILIALLLIIFPLSALGAINFIPPTPANGVTITTNSTTIAVSVTPTTTQLSSFIDWNKSLIGYWNLNQGTGATAIDQSTYTKNCTLVNGPTWITGKFGKALNFDGTNDYLNCNSYSNFNATSAITIEAWVMRNATITGLPRIVGKNRLTAYALRMNSSGKIELAGKFGTTAQQPDFSSVGVSSGQWAHVAATYDGNIIRYYINGTAAGTAVPSTTGVIGTNNDPLYIGAESPTPANYFFPGKIDEVRIWNRVLSAQEIKASYNTSLYNLSNTFTNLANATYQYYAKSINTPGTTSQTENRTLTVNYGSSTPCYSVIRNSLGHEWAPVGSNIQLAINDLNGAGEVWLPEATMTLSSFTINHNGVKIHGCGPNKTILNFTGSNYGIMASELPGSGESSFQWGLQNLQFDNFKFKGSAMWIVIRKGLLIENVDAEDVTRGYAAIRIIAPYGKDNDHNGWTDSTGHYWSGSIDGMMEDVDIINCHTNRTASHGFHLWSTNLLGIKYKNILFDGCKATKGGYGSQSTDLWSVGFDFGELWNVDHTTSEATIENLTVQNCEAYENWESGFHIENKIKKTNVYFTNCTSKNNGQKYLQTSPPTNLCCKISSTCCKNGCENKYDEAWCNPYGAGFLHSYKANPLDSNMVFTDCVANGNGAWGYRGSATPCPTFVNSPGDAYPSNPLGNGRGTIPEGADGGLCKTCCPSGNAFLLDKEKMLADILQAIIQIQAQIDQLKILINK